MQQFYGLGGLDHNLLRVALATFLEVRGSTYPAIVAAKANQRIVACLGRGSLCKILIGLPMDDPNSDTQ